VYNYVNLVMLLDKSEAGAYLAHGVYGGPEGKLVYPTQIMIAGAYSVENPPLLELGLATENDVPADLMIKFYGTCPIDFPGNRAPINPERPDDWRETSLINCKLDGGPLLGKGWGVGAYIFTKVDGLYTLEIADEQIFDDLPKPSAVNFLPATPAHDRCGSSGSLAAPSVTVQVRVDGVTSVLPPFDGRELQPFGKGYHQYHEAAGKIFAKWTQYKTDAQIREFRTKAFMYFKDDLKIGTVNSDSRRNPNIVSVLANPMQAHVHNDIALGGGTIIFPYAVNDVLNQRAYTLTTSSTTISLGTAGTDADSGSDKTTNGGIVEAGFIMVVGRGGVHSAQYGFLPFGTVARYGVMHVRGLGRYGDVELQFQDRMPMVPDLNDHYIIDTVIQSDAHPDLADGHGIGLVTSFVVGGPNFDNRGKTSAQNAGVQRNTRFAMVFGSYVNHLRNEADLGVTCVNQSETGDYYRLGGAFSGHVVSTTKGSVTTSNGEDGEEDDSSEDGEDAGDDNGNSEEGEGGSDDNGDDKSDSKIGEEGSTDDSADDKGSSEGGEGGFDDGTKGEGRDDKGNSEGGEGGSDDSDENSISEGRDDNGNSEGGEGGFDEKGDDKSGSEIEEGGSTDDSADDKGSSEGGEGGFDNGTKGEGGSDDSDETGISEEGAGEDGEDDGRWVWMGGCPCTQVRIPVQYHMRYRGDVGDGTEAGESGEGAPASGRARRAAVNDPDGNMLPSQGTWCSLPAPWILPPTLDFCHAYNIFEQGTVL
jgi:hypothetical protein